MQNRRRVGSSRKQSKGGVCDCTFDNIQASVTVTCSMAQRNYTSPETERNIFILGKKRGGGYTSAITLLLSLAADGQDGNGSQRLHQLQHRFN